MQKARYIGSVPAERSPITTSDRPETDLGSESSSKDLAIGFKRALFALRTIEAHVCWSAVLSLTTHLEDFAR